MCEELTDDLKVYYTGKNNARNRVSIVVAKNLKEKIVGLCRLGDRMIKM